MVAAHVAKMFFMGRNPQVFYWFKCISSQSMLQLMVSQGTTLGLELRSKLPEMFCVAAWEGVPMCPALLA